MKTITFAKWCFKEIIRDPLNIIFGRGFPVILLLLLSAIQANIPVELFTIEKLTPGITKGTITRIVEGARNPYLLDDGYIGWVNDDCILEPKPTDYKVLYEEEVAKNKKLEDDKIK